MPCKPPFSSRALARSSEELWRISNRSGKIPRPTARPTGPPSGAHGGAWHQPLPGGSRGTVTEKLREGLPGSSKEQQRLQNKGGLLERRLEKQDRAVSNSNTPEDIGALKVLGLDQIPPLTPPTIWGLQAGDIGQCGPQCPRKGKGR